MSRYKSARSRACDVSKEVRDEVIERDKHKCIFCPSHNNITMAHYISRGAGGLGIKENIACVCIRCHHDLDHTRNRNAMLCTFKQYLNFHYPNFGDKNRVYDRRTWLKE